MNYAELKAAILKVKTAVENSDAMGAFAALADLVKLAGDFFGATTFAACPVAEKTDLAACVADLEASCAAAAAVPKFGGGLWLPLVLQIVKAVIDGMSKK